MTGLRPDAPPAEVYSGTLVVEPVISAWLGDRQLATSVPVVSGSFAKSVRTAVPERLELTVPRRMDGVDWLPRSHDHPLARFGQVLDVALRVSEPVTSRSWLVRLGRCQVQDWSVDGGDISVSGVGMMQRVEDHRIARPWTPGRAATLASEARRLVSPTGLEVYIDPALRDRTVPDGITWGENRMDTLLELAQAWPARVRSDVTGRVMLLPPLPEAVRPVATLTDGVGGTLVGGPVEDTRDGVFNHVVVEGKENGKSFRVERFATVGPFSVRTYRTVTKDPIVLDRVTTGEVARRVADAELVKALSTARILPVTHAPDYRLDVDVPLEVVTHDTDGSVDVHEWGYVTGVEIPLTASGGDMRTDVGVYR